MFFTATEAGYVDLYRDADFKHKLLRIKNIILDVCYSFTCDDLDNAITSAKWHGLPETGSYFGGGDAIISFHTGENCDGERKWWYIDTQSKKDKYFPENFRLDGINDDISSFVVLNKGSDAGTMYTCALLENEEFTNTTGSETNNTNNTISYPLE
ncbi:hypothetical protein PHMEG_00035119 [Phytophthora megakarya]|uniref:Uncharacterized protein n=1 Tax=Phytophthora megakarya TaxID=4795 RepID=A0A225UPV1_9STRA|nr:hypothetical protein PHMEG_00035119 [Phytophthora megakarya]